MAALFDLSGKTALITGGSRGIGKAQAIALASAGADVILIQACSSQPTAESSLCGHFPNISKGSSPVDTTRTAVEKTGSKCYTYSCNLNDKAAVAGLVDKVTSNHAVDILVNVAGIQRRSEAEKFPTDTFEEIIQVNLTATFVLCRDMGKYWLEHGMKGKIINTASLATFLGNFRMVGYSMSKGGVGQLTKALSNEWASRNINVNAIAPGYIETDMNIDIRTGDPAFSQSLTQRIPAGRWGVPEDFIGPTVFLASAASDYVHGHILLVDGGYLGR